MAFLNRLIAAPASLCLLCCLPVQANDTLSFSASARAGLENQSNVNISELEQASGQSDVATLLEADINMQWQTTPALRFEGGYSVQDKNYHQADAFDRVGPRPELVPEMGELPQPFLHASARELLV